MYYRRQYEIGQARHSAGEIALQGDSNQLFVIAALKYNHQMLSYFLLK